MSNKINHQPGCYTEMNSDYCSCAVIGLPSQDVYDAILDRPEAVGPLSELEMKVEWLEERVAALGAEVENHERLIEIIERYLSREDRL